MTVVHRRRRVIAARRFHDREAVRAEPADHAVAGRLEVDDEVGDALAAAH
jgi:hypothetical protein